MPLDEDKYPVESGRRRFVKGVVGSAALSGLGTGAAAAIGSTTTAPGAGGGVTQYLGIENTDGPAPRGMPLVPLTIENGELKGIWPDTVEDGVGVMDIGGQTYRTSWFQYCGVQTYPGVEPNNDQDNFFRAASDPPYEWQADAPVEGGDKLTVDLFDDYETWGNGIGRSGIGKPAQATWRSDGLSPQETIPVQILRSTRIEEMAGNDDAIGQWLDATTEQGFIAWLGKCTHFCCVPSFKGTEQSAKFGGEDRVYCPCHQSVYDPFSIIQKAFVALPRPEE
ncbi:ubiquinol-cytochrome c reductase iron-sulfur subunit [Halorarius halobius]|uniref:ubiquinol-cytochrome c reductase iron-sulfur subunit n=1 Tax=Halorarius halobius TaxID=2962671 RepID=UPI0020CE539D|nr:ubiquinol-cytochrome c reductase iron-sulfur subunit [Halorarius halobius]